MRLRRNERRLAAASERTKYLAIGRPESAHPVQAVRRGGGQAGEIRLKDGEAASMEYRSKVVSSICWSI